MSTMFSYLFSLTAKVFHNSCFELKVSMLSSLDEFLHAQNMRYQLIPSRNIVYERILESDWPYRTESGSLPYIDNYFYPKKYSSRELISFL